MAMVSNIWKSETINMAAAVVAVLVLGFGTATAAINAAPPGDVNPAMRPLTIGRSLHVQPAFGPDDEDCVYVTHKVTLSNGKVRTNRKLECAE